MSAPVRGRSVGAASLVLASGTVVSRVLGFVKIFALATAIGVTNGGADAYQTATIVPNSIYAIIAGGLLSAVLVPQIVRASRAADGGTAYINKLVTIAVIGFAAIAAVATLSAPLLMRLYGVGGPRLGLATAFAFWSLPQIFFLGLYTVLGEVLNARRSFGPYTWAPVLNNVVAIGSIGIFLWLFGGAPQQGFSHWSPLMIAVLAAGATVGLAAQALVLFAAWRHVGLTFRPDFRWRGVNLGATGRAGAWTFGMLITTQLAGLVQTNVANSASGDNASVAAMSTAWLIFMLPHSIITVSLVTVYYPRMSEHAADHDLPGVRGDVGQAMRTVLTLLVLASVALLTAALPFARMFAVNTSSAHALGGVLMAYLAGLVPFSALFVVQRAFYALADTRTPFLFTLAQVALVVAGTVLCLMLPAVADRIAAGIAAVVSLGGTAQLGIAAVLLKRRIGGLGGPEVGAALLRALAAAVPAAAAGIAVLALLGGLSDGWALSGKGQAFAATALVGAVVVVVHVAVLALLRSPELAVVTRLARGRRG